MFIEKRCVTQTHEAASQKLSVTFALFVMQKSPITRRIICEWSRQVVTVFGGNTPVITANVAH